jgi:hypothetical protein
MFKKGDMSLNVIVAAALALIVLVVLTAIFVSRMNTSADKTQKNDKTAFDQICLQPRDGVRQSKCVPRNQCTSDDGWTVLAPAAGTGTGSGNWMDCPPGSDSANLNVCCIIKNS